MRASFADHDRFWYIRWGVDLLRARALRNVGHNSLDGDSREDLEVEIHLAYAVVVRGKLAMRNISARKRVVTVGRTVPVAMYSRMRFTMHWDGAASEVCCHSTSASPDDERLTTITSQTYSKSVESHQGGLVIDVVC